MNKEDLFDVDIYVKKMSRKSLRNKFNEIHTNEESSSAMGNWCEALSSSLSNANAKQAWRSGTEKLSQTFNNVRTTFEVLSQRIKKSTRKRQPLINVESPVSPITPYNKSRAALGRTPTKLYSPFCIDTPTGKENFSNRCLEDQRCSTNLNIKEKKKKLKRTKLDLDAATCEASKTKETVLSNDLLQTRIGIYEFQSVANRIAQNGLNN